MKKFLFCILVLFLFVTGCSGNESKGYTKIDYDEYVRLKENGETFPLVIGRTGCSACEMFKGTMESFISKYGVDVKYIDIADLTDEQKSKFSSEINFESTPTTVFFKNGKQTSVYYRLVGAQPISNVIDAYKRMGYIG